MTATDVSDWPTSALQAAATAYAALTCEPDPLSLDCDSLGDELGLPAGQVPLPKLREWILAHRDNHAARDAVWRELVGRAHTAGPAWVIAAVGMAMPALISTAGRLARGYRGQPADLDAEILTGFLTALHRVDPDRPGVYPRLYWAAFRAGVAARHADAPYVPVDDIDAASARAPHLPYGHPDLLLARAVALHLIDEADAELIIHTRLEYQPVEQLANATGTDPAVLRMRRKRAERKVASGVLSGLLTGVVSPDTRAQLAHNAAARSAARTGTALPFLSEDAPAATP